VKPERLKTSGFKRELGVDFEFLEARALRGWAVRAFSSRSRGIIVQFGDNGRSRFFSVEEA
jgi:hypothetical protein